MEVIEKNRSFTSPITKSPTQVNKRAGAAESKPRPASEAA